jgi:putative sugar O-methyltransferase
MPDCELELLDVMLADMRTAPAVYRPTHFWQSGLDAIVADLRKRGVDSFRSHPSAHYYYVPLFRGSTRAIRAADRILSVTGPAALRDKLMNAPLAEFSFAVVDSLDPGGEPRLDIDESTWGRPVEQFVFEGRRHSRSLLNYQRGLVALKRALPDLRLRRVVEIGGGFGTLGEILAATPGITYVDVDIPPLAFVAGRYLQAAVGRDRVLDYARTRDLERIDIADIDLAVLCAWQLPRLHGEVDLFVNFISFQEMEPEVVENYVSQVKRLAPRAVLLRNSVTGKQVARGSGVGVRQPTTRADYLRFFGDDYELVFSDVRLFGDLGRQQSEVLVLARR